LSGPQQPQSRHCTLQNSKQPGCIVSAKLVQHQNSECIAAGGARQLSTAAAAAAAAANSPQAVLAALGALLAGHVLHDATPSVVTMMLLASQERHSVTVLRSLLLPPTLLVNR
jgi:hypothetical protein